MNIIIYEDEGYKNFLPLAWTRPVYDLKCGAATLAERIVRAYPKAKVEYSCRYYLPGPKEMKLAKGLFINGRLLASGDLVKKIPLKGQDEVFLNGDQVLAVRAVNQSFEEVKKRGRATQLKLTIFKYPWELITNLKKALEDDFKHLRKPKKKATVHKSAVLLNQRQIYLADGVVVEANSVLDARRGPIYLGPGTIVRPLTYLKGPLAIGPLCRIGGEVGESIFHGCSNKQHYGFIGHAYVGEWVNLGAGTTNSDLKNNYGAVKVTINGQTINSGEKFVGCYIGDFAKTGIGTLLNTGTTVGVGANLLGGRVTPKQVPSFAWSEQDRYRLEDFLKTVRVMMERRGRALTSMEAEKLKKIYQLAAA